MPRTAPAMVPDSPGTTRSVRPQMTADLMAATGLDDRVLTRLVHGFYAKIRTDDALGPIFDARIEDWPAHLDRMVDFWSSVALMTGRYHGAPLPAHLGLPVDWDHFARWLELFEETAAETCPPDGAALVTDRARRIAANLHGAIMRMG